MCIATLFFEVTLKNGKFSLKKVASCIIILDAWTPDNQEFIVLALTQSMLAFTDCYINGMFSNFSLPSLSPL
jgi:hypothetical protein